MKKTKSKRKEGVLIAKGSRLTKENFVKCPKCLVRMHKKTNGKFVIDVCPDCKGVFLDKQEIDNIGSQGFFHYVMAYFKRPKRV